ncbi:MAG: hypothetical protein HFJ97_04145 [Eubacterium sp.]|nr:hypothetical protein [Eubacterium sp.]
MNNKFSKNELLEMINSKLPKLTEEEILELITQELNKENEQVDMDYIDICYDLLEVKRNAVNHCVKTEKHKIKKPIKVMLIAAAFVVIIVSTITVSAQFNLNIPQKIAQLINGNAEIDYNLENAATTADGYALLDTVLAKQFLDFGITPITIPEEIVKENCTITEMEMVMNEDVLKIVNIDFEYNKIIGNLYIQQTLQNTESTGVNTVMDVKSGQKIKVNGMDVLIFEQKDSCSIRYKDNFTIYDISLYCDLETAIQFAESIR